MSSVSRPSYTIVIPAAGSYAVAFTRERIDRFTNLYSANPGAAINANRTGNQSNLVLPGESWPITISQQNRLGAPALPASPAYPLTPSLVNGDDINIFDPAIKVPNTAARARTRPAPSPYRGPGTGTSPLPTYLAYFARIPSGRANDAASYTGVTQFTNSAWTGHLGEYEPDPVDAGNDLHANATLRANALVAGLPANFFVMNPDVDQANITRAAATTKCKMHSRSISAAASPAASKPQSTTRTRRRTRPTSTRCAATAR